MTADHNAAAREIAHQGIPAAVIFGVPDEHELFRLRLRLAEAVGEALKAAEDRARQEGRREGLAEMLKAAAKVLDGMRDDDDLDNEPVLWSAGYEKAIVVAGERIRALATGKE